MDKKTSYWKKRVIDKCVQLINSGMAPYTKDIRDFMAHSGLLDDKFQKLLDDLDRPVNNLMNELIKLGAEDARKQSE